MFNNFTELFSNAHSQNLKKCGSGSIFPLLSVIFSQAPPPSQCHFVSYFGLPTPYPQCWWHNLWTVPNVWLCLTMYENEWPYMTMTMYDYIWLSRAMFEHVWLCKHRYDYIWLSLTMYDYIRTCMNMFEHVWKCITMYYCV